MKTILFLIAIFALSSVFGQWENQIPNYSFEDISNEYPSPSTSGDNDPVCGFDGNGGFGTSNESMDFIEEYWGNVTSWTHPLKRSPCIECPKVATADLRSIAFNPPPLNPRSGDNWGYTSKEYLVVPTFHYNNGGLDPGKSYYIEVFHKGSANKDLDIVGYKKQPKICGYQNKLLQDINANKDHSDVFMSFNASNSSGWTRYRTYFSPNNFKKWLSFGNTGEWDDIRIYEVQPNKCRDNWYFDNTVFNYPMEVFQASNNIYIGNGVDPENGTNHIAGDVIQYASSSVVLKAGNQIIIDHGTFIEGDETKVFEIAPEPCSDNLCPDELEFENQILCSESTKKIGTDGNEWGTTVHWSPSTYLDNPNSANPTFTSPGGVGAITYNVKVTYHCDASVGSYTKTHKVVVQYTNSGDLTATISASNTQWDDYNFGTDLSFSDGVTEITIAINSSPGYSKTFYKGVDFTCCSFHWDLPDAWAWSSCLDDVVRVTSRNKCSGQENTILLDWDKSTTPFAMPSYYPNVLTLYGSDVGEYLCFDVPSADYFEIEIIGRWGNSIFHISGPVRESPFCIYPVLLENKSDGTYFYKISFSDKCGNSGEAHQFFHLYHGNSNMPTSDDPPSVRNSLDNEIEPSLLASNNEESETSNKDVVLIPNPTKGRVNIVGMKENFNIEIKDDKGKLVFQQETSSTQINIENLAAGIYYVRIYNQEENIVKKLVVI